MIRAAWQGVWERKVRTILTLAGVAVCVLVLTTLDGMLGYMRVERERDANRFTDQLLLETPGTGYLPFRGVLRESTIIDALDRPDIVSSQSSPLLMIILTPADNPFDIADIIGLGIQPGREQAWLGSIGTSVGQATLDGAGDDAVIIGQEAARHYGVTMPGETIYFANRHWRVVGILHATSTTRWDKLVVLPLSSAQAAFGLDGWVSAVLLTARPGQSGKLAESLAAAYPSLDVLSQDSIRTILLKELDLPNRFMGILSWASFIMAVLIIANIMSVAVRERSQEIGKIRVFGSRRSVILSYTLIEAWILCFIGGTIGALASIPVAYVFGWDWIVSWQEIARVIGLVSAAGLLAGVYPAYRAARAYPQALQLDALRQQMETITAEKHAMDQAYGNLIRGREEESERLSRELHDQAIQSLVALKFRLADSSPEGRTDSQDQVNRIIGTLRDLCTDLRPPALDQLGLSASLRSYVSDFSERTGQPCTFLVEGDERRLPPEVELSLFRVAQEALTNSWKHAQSPKAELRLCFLSSAVRLTICDRGRGFSPPERLEALTQAGHFGLVGMFERMQIVGGTLHIQSQIGEGTIITAAVSVSPLTE